MNFVIFDVQGSNFTLLTLIYLVVSTGILIFVSKKITRFLEQKILAGRIQEKGTRLAIVTIVRYVILLFGFLLIFKTAGFDLGAFGWLLGALGVPAVLKSELYYILFKEFEKHHIEIPFPQRDIHIRSGISKI